MKYRTKGRQQIWTQLHAYATSLVLSGLHVVQCQVYTHAMILVVFICSDQAAGNSSHPSPPGCCTRAPRVQVLDTRICQLVVVSTVGPWRVAVSTLLRGIAVEAAGLAGNRSPGRGPLEAHSY